MEHQLKRYIVPNMLAMIGTSCYVLADTFFISVAAGADGITAVSYTHLDVYKRQTLAVARKLESWARAV